MKMGQRRKWNSGWLIFCAAVLLPTMAMAAEDSEDVSQLKAELETQRQRQAELENRINQLETRQKAKERTPAERVEQGAAPQEQIEREKPAGLPDDLRWLEKIKISGDLRYRYEYIDLENTEVRHRNRIRARLMISAIVNDEWDVALRMATGETDIIDDTIISDPVSTNQTLGKFASRKDFWLDLAFFDYHPAAIEGLDVIGGKMENPFYTVGKNQLMWDSDLNPEGVALKYTKPLGASAAVNVAGGGFWLVEESSGVDTSLWGIQACLRQELDAAGHILAGASWYDYANLQGLEDFFGIGFGNTIDPVTGEWVSDYDILELFAEYGTQLGKMPLSVFGTWVKNTVAATSGDTGWLVGGTLGRAKDPGSWQLGYDYRDVEPDAVLAVWNDSDFLGGRTGGKGHVFRFAYQADKNVQLGLTYFQNQFTDRDPGDPDLDYRRVQADLALKF